jgi:amidohydrolase
MFLSDADTAELVAFRRQLHERPELSGEERHTARAVRDFLERTQPDRLVDNLGGHGLAAVYDGAATGPCLMFRAELDALPIDEVSAAPYRSRARGKAHLCGHDGHMASLGALALGLSRARPKRGRVVLLFQPAEETGAGAEAVIVDPNFAAIQPDFVFAWHNMPGMPRGQASIADGPAACASRGLRAIFNGKTAHASAPEAGLSPTRAIAKLMTELTALGRGGEIDAGYSLVTITHVEMGAHSFGVAPGRGEVWATLRTVTDAGMASLVERAERLIRDAASADGLDVEIAYRDAFDSAVNAPAAVEKVTQALDAEGMKWSVGLPMRPSEDFGRFSAEAPSAMFLLGAGERHPSLHNADYDFPDELIPVAARVLMRVARDALGSM